jgi:tetratricopeptide (TPR) repeat protein
MDDQELSAWGRFAEIILAYAFPKNVENSDVWPYCAQIIEHVLRAVSLAKAEGFDHPDTLLMIDAAAGYLSALGRDREAIELLDIALDYVRKTYGEDSPRAAVLYNNKAASLFDLDEIDAAIQLAERAVSILGKDRKSRKRFEVELGKCLSNLGRMKLWHSNPREGRKFLLQAYDIHRRVLGDDHFTTAIDINNIGVSYREERNLREAYRYFKIAVDTHRKTLSATDYRLAVALANQGAMAGMLGDLDEAEALLKEATKIFRIAFNEGTDYDYFNTFSWFATTMYHKKRYGEAIEYYDLAIAKATALGGQEEMISQMMMQRRVSIIECCRYLFEYENCDTSNAA